MACGGDRADGYADLIREHEKAIISIMDRDTILYQFPYKECISESEFRSLTAETNSSKKNKLFVNILLNKKKERVLEDFLHLVIESNTDDVLLIRLRHRFEKIKRKKEESNPDASSDQSIASGSIYNVSEVSSDSGPVRTKDELEDEKPPARTVINDEIEEIERLEGVNSRLQGEVSDLKGTSKSLEICESRADVYVLLIRDYEQRIIEGTNIKKILTKFSALGDGYISQSEHSSIVAYDKSSERFKRFLEILLQKKQEEALHVFVLSVEQINPQMRLLPQLQDRLAEFNIRNKKDNPGLASSSVYNASEISAPCHPLGTENETREGVNSPLQTDGSDELQFETAVLITDMDTMQKQITDLNRLNTKLKNDNSELKTKLESIQMQLDGYDDVVYSRLQTGVSELKPQSDELQSETAALRKDMELMQRQIADLKRQNTELKNDNSELERKLESIQKRLDEHDGVLQATTSMKSSNSAQAKICSVI